jgi:hypothetical protein
MEPIVIRPVVRGTTFSLGCVPACLAPPPDPRFAQWLYPLPRAVLIYVILKDLQVFHFGTISI